MNKETIESIRKNTEEHVKYINAQGDGLELEAGHAVLQTYILLDMLDMLDNINEKLAQANINIQDVEQEVSKLNPEYK